MHPLHTERMLAEWEACDPYYDPRRRTGRTTALALEVLARAIRSPGVPMRVLDHYPTRSADKELLLQAQSIVLALGWVGFTFRPSDLTVRFG